MVNNASFISLSLHIIKYISSKQTCNLKDRKSEITKLSMQEEGYAEDGTQYVTLNDPPFPTCTYTHITVKIMNSLTWKGERNTLHSKET
jgi:hypothetical protein